MDLDDLTLTFERRNGMLHASVEVSSSKGALRFTEPVPADVRALDAEVIVLRALRDQIHQLLGQAENRAA